MEAFDTRQGPGNLEAESEAQLGLRAGNLGEWTCLVGPDSGVLHTVAESTSTTSGT